MIRLIALASLFLLAACAPVEVNKSLAASVVRFPSDSNGILIAQELDGVRVDEGRYFEVNPGAHRMKVLVLQSIGEDSMPHSFVSLSFDSFKPDEDYELRMIAWPNQFPHELRLQKVSGEVLQRFSM